MFKSVVFVCTPNQLSYLFVIVFFYLVCVRQPSAARTNVILSLNSQNYFYYDFHLLALLVNVFFYVIFCRRILAVLQLSLSVPTVSYLFMKCCEVVYRIV